MIHFSISDLQARFPHAIVENGFKMDPDNGSVLGEYAIVKVGPLCFDCYWEGVSTTGVYLGAHSLHQAQSIIEFWFDKSRRLK